MATSTSGTAQWKRLVIIAAVVGLATVAAIALLPNPSAAQADLQVDSLTIEGTNATVTGDVSSVDLAASLDYTHDVPDGERRIVRLMAGPNEDELEELTFDHATLTEGDGSGSVDLQASLLDHSAWTAADFDPELAGSTEQTVTVAAEIEVERAGGGTVTDRVTETVTLTVNDGTTLSAAVGGTVSVSVE